MFKIFKYNFFDLIRSRWTIIYFIFFLITSSALLYLGGDVSRGITSLLNVVLILCPLVGILFGIMYFYNSREFTELLLAQPIKRSSIFLGLYLGLGFSLCLSFVLGVGLPFVFYGLWISDEIWNFSFLILIGILLTLAFTALAFLIVLRNENRVKGFGFAIIVWLFLAVIYDGLFLLSLIWLESYPIDKLALGLTLVNPIDLARILMMLKLDISALMGYTGAVFQQFFGTPTGLIIALIFSLLWVLIPMVLFLRVSQKKDF